MFTIPSWAIGVAFIFLVGSLARALFGASFGEGRVRGPKVKASLRDLAQAVQDLEKRLGAVEEAQGRPSGVGDLEHRLGEVEERLDFAERLLAKQRDGERLAPPKG